ncbi:Translocator protein [Trichoplax sp. H2]|uniref:Translocator protein n=1 Tax=Trichoplax adhaerens TaxID=10228 RepID=B3RRP2_TRIAD|nr:hypothetical protein TRIADDRAFT_22860 [Trichoplax adhaerens]EDV26386.1 hypothetical protein TRIADDRAFT_22860 [Trichoplax adhaerens]RDD43746.1 Translocator protein [Trichoplax sp. H2]|eukprot:XP_002110382.1 hypothetical protein TRIADDRAFT_22860 [Trichoplax adhaerens]
MIEWAKIAIAISIPQIGSYVSNHVAISIDNSWYRNLKKPHMFNTPSWIISPFQITTYSATGYASYLVLRGMDNFGDGAAIALTFYGASLALNFTWLPLCYQTKNLGLATVGALATWGCAIQCVRRFYPISITAGRLTIPYLAWLSYKAIFNIAVWWHNSKGEEIE